jgi:aryl-alcohol dehydrogenase-like predicted oxidoreductase
MKNRIMSDLKKVFRPEFLNRIDEVIVFHKLAKEEVKEIVDLMINRVRVQVAEHELQLDLTDEAKDLLVDKGWDPSMGARPLRRAIQRYIEDPLADEVLRQGQMAPGSTVMVKRDPSGDEDDRPLSLTIVKPKKPARPKKAPRRTTAARAPSPASRTRATSSPLPTATPDPGTAMREPGRSAIGTWSGGRFLHYGVTVDEQRLAAVIRPGNGVDTVITADTYGQGEADSLLGRALAGVARDEYSLVGAVGHDFYEGERDGPRGFPRFTDPRLRGEGEYANYLRMAAERSLERLGASSFDLLLLHNPDRIGYSSEAVWDGMAALRDAGLTAQIGVAPGPANGFTLDLIACLERFGDRIDWAMIILNPFEPWPGELCLDAAERHRVKVITRVVDYGGLFWGDLHPGMELAKGDHRAFRPDGWIEAGLEKLQQTAPIRERVGLSLMHLACHWNLAHPAVECVVPTLIQEAGPEARPIEDKRTELAELAAENPLSEADVAEIRAIGDNTGCMALKGASPQHEGEERPDRWPLSDDLIQVGQRWGIDSARDLVAFR